MKFKNVVIDSFAYAEPELFLSSDEFEERLKPVYSRLKLPEGRLELQTGVKRRGYWPVGTHPSDIATRAARKLFLENSVGPGEIDLMVYTGVCRDYLEPSTASYIHKNLELSPECINYDLSNACLGFLNGIDLAAKQIEAGIIKKALIVTGENSGPLIEETIKKLNGDESLSRKDIKKYVANLTIGSAGVAFVISHEDLSDSHYRLENSYSMTDSMASSLCQGSGGVDGLMMETDSPALLEAGISLASKTWSHFTREHDENFDHFISHQVGIAHTQALYKKLDIDITKDFATFDLYGNTGSAAVPLTFIKAYEKGEFKSGSRIALLGIGSGLHSIMMGIKC